MLSKKERRVILPGIILVCVLLLATTASAALTQPIVVDHTSAKLSQVPLSAIQQAKTNLHIAYGHTSHGSQITDGMSGLTSFAGAPYGGSTYTWNNGGTGGALDLRDTPFSGASDLGNPDRVAWANATRTYLNSHPDVNVIMWSWCGQADTSASDIATYLNLMNQLESEYPDVRFVYMTGHLVGTGESGNLNQRNEQIRAYARANNKILYDFADIESFDPDGLVNYMKLNADDGCNYNGGNWATAWQNSHAVGTDWYNCGAAHTQPLNANQKAYAAWHLWARLGGWDGTPVTPTQTPTTTPTTIPTTTPTTIPTATPTSTPTTEPTTIPTTEPTAEPTATPTTIPTTSPSHTVPVMSAGVSGNTVIVSWQRIADPDFLGYKVVISKNNDNPAYPGDGYLYWITDRETTSATVSKGGGYHGGDFGGTITPGESYAFSVTALYQPYTPVAGNAVRLTFPGGATPTATPTAVPTTTTPPAPIPPMGVDDLQASSVNESSVTWTWKDPANPDFTEVRIYLDNELKTSVPKGVETYQTSGLAASTAYTIGTETVASTGAVNTTRVSRTTSTSAAPVVTPTPVPAPVANFTADRTSGTVPLSVRFTDTSLGAAAYSWDFENDGSVDSTETSPEHTYMAAGTFTVNLTVTNSGGSASEIKTDYITVRPGAPVANFTANQTTGYAPLAVEFRDISAGVVTYRAWDFGNDGIVDSTDPVAVHTFATPGNYTVNLTVANSGGWDSAIRTAFITVRPVPAPVAGFSANVTSGMAPLPVRFTDESTGAGLAAWTWDFNGDGVADSVAQNPEYTYQAPGNYSVSLAVRGDGGTTTEVKTGYIRVTAVPPAKPVAEFTGTPTSGTVPLVVKFTDKSTGQNITSWAWDFNGDGVTDSSEQNPSFTYTTKGNYTVSLTAGNAGGSDTKVRTDYIRANTPAKPVAGFSADKQSGTAPLTVKFTDRSTGTGITAWSWDFNNDGTVDSTEKNPSYTYSTAGKYSVRLAVTNTAGTDTVVRSDYINVTGQQPPAVKKPVAIMSADKTWGSPPMTVRFADKSTNNPTSRTWIFGDGASSTEKNPTHRYTQPGIYFARLVVENSAGSDQDSRFIFVLPKWLSWG